MPCAAWHVPVLAGGVSGQLDPGAVRVVCSCEGLAGVASERTVWGEVVARRVCGTCRTGGPGGPSVVTLVGAPWQASPLVNEMPAGPGVVPEIGECLWF